MTGLCPEGCGRLMAAGCVEGLRKKVLRIDGPFRAQGFLSLTALRAEGCGLPLCGNAYKVSVTDLLSVSYDMISILLTGSLRSPPPFRLRRTFPHRGDRINRSMLPCRDMTPWLSTHSAPACGGKVVAPATKGGSPSPAGRLYGFRRQRRHKKWRPKAPYLASAAILYNSRGREPSTRL